MFVKYEYYKKKVDKKRILKEIFFVYILAVIFVFLFNSIILQAYKIPSNSMEPQIEGNTLLLVNKFLFGPKYPFSDKRIFNGIKNLRRGDIIVFMSDKYFHTNITYRILSTFLYTISFSLIELPNLWGDKEANLLIKRVIGIPGDTIKEKVVDGKVVVFINGIAEKNLIKKDYKLIEIKQKSIDEPMMILQNGYKVKENEYYVLGDNRVDSYDSRKWGSGINANQIIGKAILKYYPLFGVIK